MKGENGSLKKKKTKSPIAKLKWMFSVKSRQRTDAELTKEFVLVKDPSVNAFIENLSLSGVPVEFARILFQAFTSIKNPRNPENS